MIWRVFGCGIWGWNRGDWGKDIKCKGKGHDSWKSSWKERTYWPPGYKTADRLIGYNYEECHNGKCKTEEGEGVSSPKKKEVFQNSHKKVFQGSPQKGKGISKPGQKPIKCYRCDGWGHGWKECPTPENLNWRELVGAVVPSNPEGSGSIPTLTPGCSQWSQKH